jgi:hypothetical protein
MDEKYIKILSEDINLSEYSDEDFVEVFVMEFRPWIRKNHGDEVGQYPMSLLVKKYIKQFALDSGIEESDLRWYSNILNQMTKIGQHLVRQEIVKLPSLKKDIFFTQKFKKILDHFIDSYNFPDFVKVHFEEDSPFKVSGWITVEFEPSMKYDGDFKNVHAFPRELNNLITNYMGFELGSPAHGKLEFQFGGGVRFLGVEDWVKNVLNKKIKKEIKTLPNRSSLHSMKFTTNTSSIRGEITLVYVRNAWYSNQENFKSEFQNYLKSLGYNSNRLLVSGK